VQTILFNHDKVGIALADHSLRVGKTVNVNGNPTAVQEYEVRISDHSEMVRTVSLDEEFFRMPAKLEHFSMARSELVLVYNGRLIRVHVRLAGGRA